MFARGHAEFFQYVVVVEFERAFADIKDYSLAINNYIDKREQESVSPAEVRRKYFEAYDEMISAEEKMRKLLVDGGYINE